MQIQPPSEPFQQYHASSPYRQSTSGSTSTPQHPTLSQDDADEMDPYQQQHQQQHQQQQQQYHSNYAQQQQPPPPLPPPQHSHRPYMQNQQLPPIAASMNQPMVMPTHGGYMSAQQPTMAQQAQQSLATSTRPGIGNPPQEKKQMFSNTIRNGHEYSLDVVQQPQRARMCGFGDKDRRPITPPPCVRLVIKNTTTGKEVDIGDVNSDPSFFVLQVDLWADTGDREANVVRASSNSPAVSISSATTTSYPPPAEHPRLGNEGGQMLYMGQDGQPAVYQQYPLALTRPMSHAQYGGMYYPVPPPPIQQPFMPATQSNSAMYTRNLIGSLTVNASQLKDPGGKDGFWFVLQDLSVRTEGLFRLRMSFIDISNQGAPGVNRGKAPVLSWTFSEVFQVYSAKKFPGVIESTQLSKTFAGQGIKIPIRKDNKSEQADDEDGND